MFRFFENCINPFQSYDETTPPATAWQFIYQQLLPLRHIIAVSLFIAVIAASLEVWMIGYAGRLVDTLATTPPDQLWATHGREYILAALLVLIARPSVSFLREAINDVAFRPNAVALVRWRAHRHVLQQSVGWFNNNLAGHIANRVRESGSASAGAAYQVFNTLVVVMIYIVGSIWLMAATDLRLIIPLLVWLGLYLTLMRFAVPRFQQNSEKFQSALSDLSGMLVDTYANIATIKLFSSRSHEDRESQHHFEASRTTFVGLQRIEVVINVGMILLGSFLIVTLVGYAVLLWQAGDAPLGLIAAALALSFRISAMAEWLLDSVSGMFGYLGALRESLKTVAQPLTITDAPNAPALTLEGGAIELINISHHYGKVSGGLDHISLSIAAGEKVGLVGRSGAGKSTLVNLIMRFFDPENGTIEIDGQNIANLIQDSLRENIGMVMQDASLLHRSIYDNIAYGRANPSRAEVEAAAQKAQAHGFILTLQDNAGRTGYDAYVGERGVTLSGGQRQRIALARTILKNAPILILDEATSALDSEIEAAIQDTLYDVMADKTVIAIAHRLSTIAHMDTIVVLDNGRITEQGSHQDLLDQNGIYAALWARQSGGYIGQ